MLPSRVDGPRAKCREDETSPLVEAERFEIVIGRDEPQPFASSDRLQQRVQKRGTDARVPLECGNEGELALVVVQTVCHKPDRPPVTLCDEAGKSEHVEQAAAPA